MSKLTWDGTGERFYETGVRKGVLYIKETDHLVTGYAWNGLTAVNENPSGAEANPLYADDIKYLNLMSNEEFSFTIEAYSAPEKFAECDGSKELIAALPGITLGQQKRKSFGFSYQTRIGNDEDGIDKGYKIHLCYGCLASPSSRDNATINDNPEAMTLSWEVSTTPVDVSDVVVGTTKLSDFKPISHLVIDSTKIDEDKLTALESALYGQEGPTEYPAYLPTIENVLTILLTNSAVMAPAPAANTSEE